MDFFKNNQNNHVCRNYLDDFLGVCDPPDVEHGDILEANYHNSFAIGVVKNKQNIEILPTTNATDENFEVTSETAYGGQKNKIYYIIKWSTLGKYIFIGYKPS